MEKIEIMTCTCYLSFQEPYLICQAKTVLPFRNKRGYNTEDLKFLKTPQAFLIMYPLFGPRCCFIFNVRDVKNEFARRIKVNLRSETY